ncbi:MAG: recombination protein RecR [Ignavibacteriaceae bacterium]|nr:recombination protein RecR [Ignavibacteriaceae bacterium]
MQIAAPLQAVIDELSKFPGIGSKTARRLALYLLKRDISEIESLIGAISDLKHKLGFCTKCFNLSESELCVICANPSRDNTILCVVEDITDVISIEKSSEFNGVYHVLGGVLSPLNGVTQDDLKIKELSERVMRGGIYEVILALNPDTEGETTSLYLARLYKDLGIKITRLAKGLPVGGNIEFADEATVGKAVKGRLPY